MVIIINNLRSEIKLIEEELINIRRYLHQNPEVGFELENTTIFVKNKLIEYGYVVEECGKCGLVANIDLKKEKTILFRSDMDALPVKEESNISFKADLNMHACGHDIHTTILLGLAKMLCKYSKSLNYNIRFMFQPAEELLEGAKDMIKDGVLDNVDEAYMIHVITQTTYDTGTLIISDVERTAPSCDYFMIKVIGKSVHGALPSLGIDPIIIGSNIVNSLKHIETNEIESNDSYTLTFGTLCGGNTYNIIPDEVILKGTLRTYDENVRVYAKNRIVEISNHIAKAFNGLVEISYPTSAPVLINNIDLVNETYNLLTESGLNILKISSLKDMTRNRGSEDFAYVSQRVKSVMLNLCAGKMEDGFNYPLHSNKVTFDEDAIYYGVLTFLLIALKKAL